MLGFLLIVAMAYLAAFTVVGIPAILLKLLVRQLLATANKAVPRRLFWRSLIACSMAGFVVMIAIIFTVPLSSPLWIGGIAPQEAIIAATLILAVALLEMAAWHQGTGPEIRMNSPFGFCWLIGSNLWIFWAIFLMLHFGSSNLETSCLFLDEIGAAGDRPACLAGPRGYWLAHPERQIAIDALPISD